MAVETREVSFYTCDSPECEYAVYREVDADGLPAGYHGAYSEVDGDARARGIDWYSCTWDHVPSAMSNALAERGHAVENDQVPDHHTKGEMPSGGGGLRGRIDQSLGSGRFESSYDHEGGSEALVLGDEYQLPDNAGNDDTQVGTSYAAGYGK